MNMTDAAYRIVVEQGIRNRWATERWYRANRWAAWTDLRAENRAALKALLEVRRMVRRVRRLDDPTLGHPEHERFMNGCRGCEKEMTDSSRLAVGIPWTDPKG